MKSEKPSHGGNKYSLLCKKLGLKPEQKIIAIWGYPDKSVVANIINAYPEHLIVDLDIYYEAPESKILPENYCQIITNIIDNAVALKNKIEVIIASTGEEKCDQGRFAAYILEKLNFNVIKTKYLNHKETLTEPIISTSTLPLKDKVLLIMDSMLNQGLVNNYKIEKSIPTHGFWGVPPNDIELLTLFPDTTHVFGWTRTVEMKRPADLDLEMYVDESIPTVFFAQTFCAKMQLAKFLAKKYEGLYVDADDFMSVSVKAKIEAFLRLS